MSFKVCHSPYLRFALVRTQTFYEQTAGQDIHLWEVTRIHPFIASLCEQSHHRRAKSWLTQFRLGNAAH